MVLIIVEQSLQKKKHPEMEQPLYYWIPSIAPSGFAYVSTKRYKGGKVVY